MISTDQKLAFAPVIKAIEKTSAKELSSLGRIEKTLKGQALTHSTPRAKPKAQSQVVEEANVDVTVSQVAPSVDVSARISEVEIPDVTVESAKAQEAVTKTESITHIDNRDMKQLNTNHSETVNQVTQAKDEAVLSEAKKQTKALQGLWKDANGRLRQESGAFASQKQKEQFEQAHNNSDDDEEKTPSSLLMAVSKWASDQNQQDTLTTTAGTGVAGSYWSAAIESKEAFTEFKEKLENNGLGTKTDAKDTIKRKLASASAFFSQTLLGKEPVEDGAQSASKEQATPAPENAVAITQVSPESNQPSLALAQRQEAQAQDDNLADDMVQWQQRTVEAIEGLNDEISDISVGAGQGGLLDDLSDLGDIFGSKNKKGKSSAKGRIGKAVASALDTGKAGVKVVGKAATSMLGKIAVPLTALIAGTSKYNDVKHDETLTTTQKTAQVASTATGAAGGALAGASAGAAIGSVVPVVGTVIGGLLGAALGGWLGQKGGEYVGEAISDSMPSAESIATAQEPLQAVATTTVSNVTAQSTQNSNEQFTDTLGADLASHTEAVNRVSADVVKFNDTPSHYETTKRQSLAPQKLVIEGQGEMVKAMHELNATFKKVTPSTQKITERSSTREVATRYPSQVEQIHFNFPDTTMRLIAMDNQ